MSKRLPSRPREWIDRETRISFEFEGVRYEGFAGDVVTSALLGQNKRLLGRSFKYHRPRGVLSMANHDANVLLQSQAATNIRGDITPICEGQSLRAVNTLLGLKRDFMQYLSLFSRFLPVGFYYKAFYRPRWAFPFWERLIREMAGLGRVDTEARGYRQSRQHRFCDLLIIGAGASGLATATHCADTDLDVVIIDENRYAGGSLDFMHAGDEQAQSFREAALKRIDLADNVELLTDACAGACYDRYTVPVVTLRGVSLIQSRAIVFATGVIEQPAVFRNNDLPGVMMATAAQRLIQRYAVAPCDTCVVLTANDEGYRAALDYAEADIRVAAVVDMRAETPPNALTQELLARGVQLIPNAHVDEARAKRGHLASVVIHSNDQTVVQEIVCDSLMMSIGWAPAGSLVYQAGGRFSYDDEIHQIVPVSLPGGVFLAGRLNGLFSLSDRVADGRAAATEAAAHLGKQEPSPLTRPAQGRVPHSHPYPIKKHRKGKEFIDFDEDIQLKDLDVGMREGFDSIELLKRYSTIGMGPSQGKVSNMNGVRFVARHRGRDVNAIGVTTPRPFYHPIPMGVLAGRRLRREWHTPMHEYHVNHGADMTDTGAWRRPKSYLEGSPFPQIALEYQAVRKGVGIIDVSTLGKIEIYGRDAQALLEHAYTCTFDRLDENMTRYIFMVDSSGTIVDDGVAGRLGDGHFYVTATSTHSQTVLRQLQLFADQLKLRVAIVDRTFQLGAINIAGPRSRRVLEEMTDLELDDDKFPYLGIHEGIVAGIPARLMRVGFVGELGYEIHCDASSGAVLWDSLLAAGEAEGCIAFGVEAQRLLRLEKGHIIIGQDTDGTTNPFEVGLGWGVRLKKPRFHGKHSLQVLKSKVGRRLVGFEILHPLDEDHAGQDPIRECHLIIDKGSIVGRVTSVSFSPVLEKIIGLAYVEAALASTGTELPIKTTDGRIVTAIVTDTPFYDPDNERQSPAIDPVYDTAA